jgi:hypothetical protein
MPNSIWEVDLRIDGPVTVAKKVPLSEQKGFREDDPFFSEIKIDRSPFGLDATITARAENDDLAGKAALFFFGRMLDALTLDVDEPMNVILADMRASGREISRRRRRIEADSFVKAFQEALLFSREHPTFLRSLGWYRKGLNTADPFDQFIAFWNAIAVVASKYFAGVKGVDLKRARKGIVNQVWACLLAVWGPNEGWPLVGGNKRWVDEMNRVRNLVVHGVASVDVTQLAEVARYIPVLRQVSHAFLHDWRLSPHFQREHVADPDHQPYAVE